MAPASRVARKIRTTLEPLPGIPSATRELSRNLAYVLQLLACSGQAASRARSGQLADVGHAEADGVAAFSGCPHGVEFLLSGSQGGPDRGDFAGPPLFLGLPEPVDEVVVDLFRPWL
jgi:hypothetical protein